MRVVNGRGTYDSDTATFTTTATAYADLDVIGGRLAFSFELEAGGGFVKEIAVFDPDNVLLGQFDVFLFNRIPATVADNAAFALTDADLLSLVGFVPSTDFDNEAVDSKGFNTAYPDMMFTGEDLWMFIRNREGEDPLQFSAGKTVTVRVSVES